MDMVFTGKNYNRTIHSKSQQLSQILTQKYKCKFCVITPSGLSAISTLLSILSLKHKNQVNIIYGHELYCDTPKIINNLYELRQIKGMYKVPITDSEQITNTILDLKDDINILFVESCSNPSGYILDFSILSEIKKITKLYVVVDNTWLTYHIFNPFEYSADFVVNSLTKYYSAGSCIAGCILYNEEQIEHDLYIYQKYNGIHTSPYNCNLVLNNIKSLKIRMSNLSILTKKILQYLSQQKDIIIMHPILESHVSNKLAKQIFNKNHIPAVFSILVPYKKSEVIKRMKKSGITCLTSYGGSKSKFCPWPVVIEDKTRCRLAIGYDDNYDVLITALQKFLSVDCLA